MNKYRIYNRHSGVVLGIYEGQSATDALDAMARDAGYLDYRQAQEVAPAVPGEIAVTIMTNIEQRTTQ